MFDRLDRLEAVEDRPAFTCGDDDLDDFFHNDSKNYAQELLAVTYVAYAGDKPIAFFSVSNDSIRKEETGVSKSAIKRLFQRISHPKRFINIPSVKIARFAVCDGKKSKGIGTSVMDFIKFWFKVGNKTGCRFIVVDAYNNEKALNFYKNNGFDFLGSEPAKDHTRFMYFDLMTFDE